MANVLLAMLDIGLAPHCFRIRSRASPIAESKRRNETRRSDEAKIAVDRCEIASILYPVRVGLFLFLKTVCQSISVQSTNLKSAGI